MAERHDNNGNLNDRIPFQAQPKSKFPNPSCLNGIATRPPTSPAAKVKHCGRLITDYGTAYVDRKVRTRRKTYAAQREKVPGAKRQKKKKQSTKLLPGGLYHGRWRPGIYWPVVILSWDDARVDMKDLPKSDCFDVDNGKIVGWAPGYENGGSLAYDRWFPVIYLDKDYCIGWMHARDFFDFDQKQGYSKVREQYANLTKHKPRNCQAEPSTVVGGEFQAGVLAERVRLLAEE
ncbi:hypothetical protein PspLS_10897 [Pyricularia sp. CBS 133598]|nr:hypothetical protein PspLS_10897 [Pyricularia sp. CBS 133598]